MSRPAPRAALRTRPPAPRRTGAATALEGAAAEFALLAQRRARVGRQIALLDRQREAAAALLAQVEARMRGLGGRMALPGAASGAPAAPAAALPAPATATGRAAGAPASRAAGGLRL